jgi:hypothetical protein
MIIYGFTEKINNNMKLKNLLIFALLSTAAASCGQTPKKQAENAENIVPTDTIETTFSENANILTVENYNKLKSIEHSYQFEDFQTEIYKGKLAPPDFTNNPWADDKEYVAFIHSPHES